jgi:dinuclear metal center YbgI/SA1388 family protein
MMELPTLVDRLNDRLAVDDFADVDASANGLQVGPEAADVTHAAFAVDAAEATIEMAADRGADVLVVHHGISWGGFDRVTDRTYRLVAALAEHDLALYAAHLPLDGHPELGNAAGLADVLDLEVRAPFGELGPVHIGQRGRTTERMDRQAVIAVLDENLDTGGQPIQLLDFGPERIDDVAIVTGSGTDWLGEAADAGADTLLTGEGKQQVYHEARDAGLNVVLAGHYATETFGVRRLADLVSEWGVETTFIEYPTGL